MTPSLPDMHHLYLQVRSHTAGGETRPHRDQGRYLGDRAILEDMAEDLAELVLQQVFGVRRALRRRLAARLCAPPFTAAQVDLLRLVESAEGIGVSAAARELHLAANSVSTLVNQLAQAGCLRREADPADRRAARLFLTEAARTRLAGWRDARADLMTAALARLRDDDRAALAGALPALGRLAEAVTEVDVDDS
jgi:DNA-binding MarR family transcriptional regulator